MQAQVDCQEKSRATVAVMRVVLWWTRATKTVIGSDII